MTTTETTGQATAPRPVAEIRAELDAIAPLRAAGDITTATDLARHFAVRAAARNARLLSPSGPPPSMEQFAALTAEFAAAHALYALGGDEVPEDVAGQIREAISDGGGIGEWLWDHLGNEDTACVERLAAELDEAEAAERERAGTQTA